VSIEHHTIINDVATDTGSADQHGGYPARLKTGSAIVAALCALGAAPAAAQQAAIPAATSADAGDIVVTGSRIRNPDNSSISPINTVSGEDLTLRGSTRVEELINTLPQAFADQGGSNRGGGTGASGTATINLRNLGNQRTLVLIDGRRLMPGDPDRVSAQAPDINNVPATLVQRIDVVTGGASAVYGSDAIAGVVNFILKRDFEGVQLDAQSGLFVHENDNPISSVAAAARSPSPTGSTADGGQTSLSLTLGHNFDDGRGNVTVYGSYRSIRGVGTSARDYTICGLTAGVSAYSCALSGSTSPAQFQLRTQAGIGRGNYIVDGTTGNTLRTYQTADGYNIGPTYDLQAPDERINAGVMAHYKFSDAVEAYGQFMFMNDEADIRISPTATFSTVFPINCDNPLMSAQERNLICTVAGLTGSANANVGLGQRNAEGGSRYDYVRHRAYRGVIGARGAIASNWTYDVYGQYGRTDYRSHYINDYSLARIRNALQVVTGANGQPVCKSALNGTDPACVPFNIFAIGGVTPAALAYIQVPADETGFTREIVGSASVSGDLGFASPFAASNVGVAFGVEYREEALGLSPDATWQSGNLSAAGRKVPISGRYDVKEIFGEIRVPIVENRPFLRTLAFEGGVRYSDYTNSGGNTSFKLGGEWSPVAGLRLRGGYQRAVRAPNLVELFAPQRQSIFTTLDPCEGATPVNTLAACQRTGLTAAQYGTLPPTNGQALGTLIGGNPNLKPETSQTRSVGLQLTPAILPRLSISVDYYDIKVKDLIGTIPINLSLAQCIATGDAYFCGLIHRDPASGSLLQAPGVYVSSTSLNTGSLATSGIDVSVNYRQELGDIFRGDPGHVDLAFSGTYTEKYRVQSLPGLGSYDCAGYFGSTCGQPIPEWRHRARLSWTAPSDLSLSATWRYIGSTANDKSSSSPFLAATYRSFDRKLKTTSYIDIAASITIDKSFTLRAGVNNLFDIDPPLTASLGGQTSNGSFFAGMYDPLGRYAFVGATAKF
jgi:iron complex outermembrane receptor protein